MHVIGTAGHIDHGKTSLIERLTGVNTDRLQEEQARGMTIDLGFTFLALPSGREVGLVDVPGHHRFIKNMLAGVSAIQLLLLVIAADDGWMPQTEEHAAIASLLDIRSAIVVITKSDLVEPDWLELVMQDVQERLAHTTLTNSPILPVSSVTGQNIPRLLELVDQSIPAVASDKADQGTHQGSPLLWVDRVFSIKGSGTVITGTLLHGTLSVGEEIVIEPKGITARIRSLQTHQTEVDQGTAPTRLAINVVNIPSSQIKRGMYITRPQQRLAYSCINAHAAVLSSAPSPLESEQELKLYVGTAEIPVKTRLLQPQSLQPGQEGFVQLQLEEPTHFSFRDRFILRQPTQGQTIAGGQFLEEGIPVRGQNFRLVGPSRLRGQFLFDTAQPTLNRETLIKKRDASLEEFPSILVEDRPYWTKQEFAKLAGSSWDGLVSINDYVLSPSHWKTLQRYIISTLQHYHKEHRLAAGMPKETMRTHLGLPAKLLNGVVANIDEVMETDGALHHRDHQVTLCDEDVAVWNQLKEQIEAHPFAPPTHDELMAQGIGQALLSVLLHTGKLTAIAERAITTPDILDDVKTRTAAMIEEHGELTLGTFRDTLNTSRKHALAFLEYFDEVRFTKRIGDKRVLS